MSADEIWSEEERLQQEEIANARTCKKEVTMQSTFLLFLMTVKMT